MVDFVLGSQIDDTFIDTATTVVTPVIDPDGGQLYLEAISLTRVLDSTVWNLLTAVFEQRIIGTIRDRARLDLRPRIAALEAEVLAQLKTARAAIQKADNATPKKVKDTTGKILDALDQVADLADKAVSAV